MRTLLNRYRRWRHTRWIDALPRWDLIEPHRDDEPARTQWREAVAERVALVGARVGRLEARGHKGRHRAKRTKYAGVWAVGMVTVLGSLVGIAAGLRGLWR